MRKINVSWNDTDTGVVRELMKMWIKKGTIDTRLMGSVCFDIHDAAARGMNEAVVTVHHSEDEVADAVRTKLIDYDPDGIPYRLLLQIYDGLRG